MPILVYEYGLLPPTEKANLVDSQMRSAHRYRNKLVEIELERRKGVRAAMGAHEDMAPLEEQIAEVSQKRDDARAQLLQTRKATRSRSDSADVRAAVRDLGARLRELRAKVKELRKAVAADAVVHAAIVQADQHAHDRIIEHRKSCGVYWGTYLLQEADAQRARQEKFPPKFRRWTGSGRVSVQLQGGLEVKDLWGTDTQVQVDPVSDVAHNPLMRRGARRRAQRTTLRIRVGSEHRRPIWAEFPMVYHRPLPEGSVIKVVTIIKRPRDCHTWFWLAQFTIEAPEVSYPSAQGAVALNLGFSVRPDGSIRSGYLVGSDGIEQEVIVSRRDIDAISKANDLQSKRDNAMNVVRDDLVAWKATLLEKLAPDHKAAVQAIRATYPDADGWEYLIRYMRHEGPAVPMWFMRATANMHAWRSCERFRALAYTWRANRFVGDGFAYFILNAWRYHEEHLQSWEANMRRIAIIRRRDEYRKIASSLRSRYHTVIVDDTDLREFQRSPAPESEAREIPAVKTNQRLAAGSVLRTTILNAFGSRKWKTSAKNVTKRCHKCGVVNELDRLAMDRQYRCNACNATFDQDANAGHNLLLEYSRREQTEVEADPSESGSRWSKIKSKKRAADVEDDASHPA